LKIKLLGVILLAFICWAVPIKWIWAKTTETKTETKTKPPEDYITENIVIKNNAIQAKYIPPLEPKQSSVEIRRNNSIYNSTRYAEANGEIQILAKEKVVVKWNESEWPGFHYILDHESGSNPYAINPNSGACGIPQALPCSKLLSVIGSLDNISGQLDWMVSYIADRYGTPTKAMQFHQLNHWY